eukprot:5282118-Alexandrium_andersonii.AAC.1
MAKPALLEAYTRESLWPSSGQRGSARATSAWHTCGGAKLACASGPSARVYVRSPEHLFACPERRMR